MSLLTNPNFLADMGGREGGKKKPLKAPKKQGKQYVVKLQSM